MNSLVDRTREFSLRLIRLYSALPHHRVALVIGDQVLRAGTSPGAHFREALRARSKAEYVATELVATFVTIKKWRKQ